MTGGTRPRGPSGPYNAWGWVLVRLTLRAGLLFRSVVFFGFLPVSAFTLLLSRLTIDRNSIRQP